MRLLDLFCGAGGAAMGYRRAGFDQIVGVDIRPQPRFPFEFVERDALEYLADHWQEFDAVHTSPPCQVFVNMAKMKRRNPRKQKHPDLLTPTIAALQGIDIPWVIENVMSAPMPCNLILCGSHFDLRVRRHRKFATSFWIPQLRCLHEEQEAEGPIVGVYGSGGKTLRGPTRRDAYASRRYRNRAQANHAMGGLDWMIVREMVQAVPPAYAEYIGRYMLEYLLA